MKQLAHQDQQYLFEQWLKQFKQKELFTALCELYTFALIFVIDKNKNLLYSKPPQNKPILFKKKNTIGDTWELFDIDNNPPGNQKINLQLADESWLEFKKYSQILKNGQGEFLGAIYILIPEAVKNSWQKLPPIPLTEHINFHGILSRSPSMKPVFQIIQNAAKTEATVLVRGESGTGKELVAHAIHNLSPRKHKPFLAINCAALSVNLLESELFGHVKGAFTGAINDNVGLFRQADGGTLFLDEVAELPLELQAKLLRVIQEQNYIPVGGTQIIHVNVRIVTATHRSLRNEVKNGRFREDLMYRLRVVPIFIPPLRERREDINLLLWHFIQQHNAKGLRIIEKIDPQAMRVLLDYHWPGNVRELQNVLEYAFVVGKGTSLKLSELPPEFREQNQKQDHQIKQSTSNNEPDAIRLALEQSNGKVSLAAEMLGLSRATFWRKRKQYGI